MKDTLFTRDQAREFADGTWLRAYDVMGAHKARRDGEEGYIFTVWAPEVRSVRVTGSFCGWDPERYFLESAGYGGVWSAFVPSVRDGDLYKFVIETAEGELIYKADPYAFWAECPPGTASRIFDPDRISWGDSDWMAERPRVDHRRQPLNIYEVHLGSWRRHEDGSFLGYTELQETLIPYAVDMGYTHIEIMPLMEHPFDGSWGYQITGYYAPTARYGDPAQLAGFVDAAHRAGLGVILDWAPAHFCRDSHGLGNFTGEPLYESGSHPQWGTYKFDLERGEVRSFLLSSAVYWCDRFHADGIRVDGVTSMLYMNFGVDDASLKRYNEDGSEEDRRSIELLRDVNRAIGRSFGGVMMMAEESTAWPLVTYPPENGGLGFHFKWDMGWMHDTLEYMSTDFPFRPSCHDRLTFSMMYAFNENFVLALSHDEVVHGKRSLIGRMPGDYWRQFAGVRLLALYQMTHPGAKLTFMGSEFAQFIEWRYYEGLEWFLLDYETHRKHLGFVRALNAMYRAEPALWQRSFSWDGYEWLDANNATGSKLAFIRRGERPEEELVVLLNFVPETGDGFRLGVPSRGVYKEIFNSDSTEFGGSGRVNPTAIESENIPMHGKEQSVRVKIPPIGGLILKRV